MLYPLSYGRNRLINLECNRPLRSASASAWPRGGCSVGGSFATALPRARSNRCIDSWFVTVRQNRPPHAPLVNS